MLVYVSRYSYLYKTNRYTILYTSIMLYYAISNSMSTVRFYNIYYYYTILYRV